MNELLEGLEKITKVEPLLTSVNAETNDNAASFENNQIAEPQPTATETSVGDNGFESEEDLINYVAANLEIDDFKPSKSGIDAIVELAQYKLNSIQEQYRSFENQELLEYKEHLENGGNYETFKQIQSLDNEYAKIVVMEDDIEGQEALAKHIYDLQGLDEVDIESLIEKRKDNGTLFDFAYQGLNRLAEIREAEVQEARNRISAEIEANTRAAMQFQQEIENALKTNNFNGVRLDNNVLREVEKQITIDANGQIPLQETVNNFNGTQHTLMNYFAYCLANNLPIEYKPVNARPVGNNKPIHSILNKQSSIQEKQGKLEDLLPLIKP